MPVQVNGTYIDSNSERVVSKEFETPPYEDGDLLVANIVSRDGRGTGTGDIVAPDGWVLYGDYLGDVSFYDLTNELKYNGDSVVDVKYSNNLKLLGDVEIKLGNDSVWDNSKITRQKLSIYYKIAQAVEPSKYTWSYSDGSAERLCGIIFSSNAKEIAQVKEEYATEDDKVQISGFPTGITFFASCWIFAELPPALASYQMSGQALIEVTDSPKLNARIGGGHSALPNGTALMSTGTIQQESPAKLDTTSLGIVAMNLIPREAPTTPVIYDVYLDSDSERVTTKTLFAPDHVAGNLLVTVVMSRQAGGGLSAPDGWLLKGQYVTGLSSQQTLSVYYKIATDTEPTSYNWSNISNSERICGTVFSTNAKSIQEVKEALSTPTPTDGQFEAGVTVDQGQLNFFASTWAYANTERYTTSNFSGGNFATVSDVATLNTRLNCTYSKDATGVTFKTEDLTELPDGLTNTGLIAIKLSLDTETPRSGVDSSLSISKSILNTTVIPKTIIENTASSLQIRKANIDTLVFEEYPQEASSSKLSIRKATLKTSVFVNDINEQTNSSLTIRKAALTNV